MSVSVRLDAWKARRLHWQTLFRTFVCEARLEKACDEVDDFCLHAGSCLEHEAHLFRDANDDSPDSTNENINFTQFTTIFSLTAVVS
jgi:hypothetical protein